MQKIPTPIKNKLLEITNGYMASRALHVASYYKIFDDLVEGPQAAEQLAKVHNLKAKPLHALLMVLANHNIIQIDIDRKFSLNQFSKFLVSTVPDSFLPVPAMFFDICFWNAIGNINIAVETGRSPFYELYGEDVFQYLSKNNKAADLINKGMQVFSKYEDEAIAACYDYSIFKVICDIGGGKGGLIQNILNKSPKVNGILLELESTLRDISIFNEEVGSRLTCIAGSFFETIPPADAFLIKRVLHNWDDKKCIIILKNCKNSLNNPNSGKIFVVEKMMPPIPDGNYLIDTTIIALALGTTERTLEEFKEIAAKAGLILQQKIDTNEGVSCLEFICNI